MVVVQSCLASAKHGQSFALLMTEEDSLRTRRYPMAPKWARKSHTKIRSLPTFPQSGGEKKLDPRTLATAFPAPETRGYASIQPRQRLPAGLAVRRNLFVASVGRIRRTGLMDMVYVCEPACCLTAPSLGSLPKAFLPMALVESEDEPAQ